MATAKKTTKDKKVIDEDVIISLYMESILIGDEEPKTVYGFCNKNNIQESDFYTFFGSLDGLKQEIWSKFLENTISTLQKEIAFATYSPKNKLLTFYFTLFEVLTLNRSYVLYALKDNKEGLRNLLQLQNFRILFIDYVKNNIATEEFESSKLTKITKPIYSEGAWIQFLLILKFWIEDQSKGFEKTDIIIEKSVNTVVDLLDSKPIENIIDLGKFLWKERKI